MNLWLGPKLGNRGRGEDDCAKFDPVGEDEGDEVLGAPLAGGDPPASRLAWWAIMAWWAAAAWWTALHWLNRPGGTVGSGWGRVGPAPEVMVGGELVGGDPVVTGSGGGAPGRAGGGAPPVGPPGAPPGVEAEAARAAAKAAPGKS